jgi:diguanylate cyclase (GGDEF)-like protein
MLDVDHFKQYNDTHGHPAGDDVLRAVGHLLRKMVRLSDLAARYGGEEFVLLLSATDAVTAKEIAERMRAAIADHPWTLGPVTASFGVATIPSNRHERSELVEAADKALYYSKKEGRDRVTHHEELNAIPPATRIPFGS